MRAAHDIIIKPIITEESMMGLASKKYTFKVAADANKIEKPKALQKLKNNIKVANLNTLSDNGKFRRYGAHEGYTASWKKAIVTLTADSKTIEFFDGLM